MKKSVITCALIAGLLSSCSSDDELNNEITNKVDNLEEVNSSGDNSKNQNHIASAADWGFTEHWAGDETDVSCTPNGKNCAPPFDVTPSALSPLDDAIAGGSDGVKDFFDEEDNWVDLFPENFASTTQLEDLQTGNYSLTKLTHNNIVMYVASNGTDEFSFQMELID